MNISCVLVWYCTHFTTLAPSLCFSILEIYTVFGQMSKQRPNEDISKVPLQWRRESKGTSPLYHTEASSSIWHSQDFSFNPSNQMLVKCIQRRHWTGANKASGSSITNEAEGLSCTIQFLRVVEVGHWALANAVRIFHTIALGETSTAVAQWSSVRFSLPFFLKLHYQCCLCTHR